MEKRFEMVMVPNQPKELRPGMLCRPVSDESYEDKQTNGNYLFIEQEHIDDGTEYESVIPFIVDHRAIKSPEKNVVYLFKFKDGECCVATLEELFDMEDVSSVHEIIANPEQIGIVYGERFDDETIHEITIEQLNSVMSKQGWCYVQMEDEFTSPEKFENVSWGNSVPVLVLRNGKCIISF